MLRATTYPHVWTQYGGIDEASNGGSEDVRLKQSKPLFFLYLISYSMLSHAVNCALRIGVIY